MKKYAFKVFYLGKNYLGYQRQPSGQAVENYIELAFVKADQIVSFASNGYKGASRTDTGVNAIANVFVLVLAEPPNLQRINYHLPWDIIVWSYAEVREQFTPRRNLGKAYRYLLPKTLLPDSTRISLLAEYQGNHDFSHFIKKHGAGEHDPYTKIEEITVNDTPSSHQIDIFGDSFGREQIRMMIGLLVDKQELLPSKILSGKKQPELRAAPPQYLWLLTIKFHEEIIWKNEPNLMYKFEELTHKLKDQKQTTSNYFQGLAVIKQLIQR